MLSKFQWKGVKNQSWCEHRSHFHSTDVYRLSFVGTEAVTCNIYPDLPSLKNASLMLCFNRPLWFSSGFPFCWHPWAFGGPAICLSFFKCLSPMEFYCDNEPRDSQTWENLRISRVHPWIFCSGTEWEVYSFSKPHQVISDVGGPWITLWETLTISTEL